MTSVSEPGLFWLPDGPEHRVEGTVNSDETGVTLVTQGRLLEDGIRDRKLRTIHGVLAGDHIKLVDAFVIESGTSGGRFLSARTHETWHCSFAFRGEPYDGDLPDNITCLEVQVKSLEDWAHGLEGIQVERGSSSHSLSWLTNQPDLTHRWSLGEVTIRQTITPSWKQARHHVREATVTTDTFFRVGFDQPQSWAVVGDMVCSLQALVSIAKGEAAAVEWTAIVEGSANARLIAYYIPILRTSGHPIKHNELFSMDELGGIAGVGKWLDVLHGQGVLKTALLIDRYREPPFITDRTGHLLMACEVYRRPSMVNPKARVDLRKDILDPMLCRTGPVFLAWIGDANAWTKEVREIRSEQGIAHFQGYADDLVDVEQIHSVNEQLYALVVVCILADCGVSKELREEVVNRARLEYVIRL